MKHRLTVIGSGARTLLKLDDSIIKGVTDYEVVSKDDAITLHLTIELAGACIAERPRTVKEFVEAFLAGGSDGEEKSGQCVVCGKQGATLDLSDEYEGEEKFICEDCASLYGPLE